MTEPHQLKLLADARLLAIEFVVTRLFALSHRELNEREYETVIDDCLMSLDWATIPGVDAVTSDAMAAEVREAVLQLLTSAKSLRKPY